VIKTTHFFSVFSFAVAYPAPTWLAHQKLLQQCKHNRFSWVKSWHKSLLYMLRMTLKPQLARVLPSTDLYSAHFVFL